MLLLVLFEPFGAHGIGKMAHLEVRESDFENITIGTRCGGQPNAIDKMSRYFFMFFYSKLCKIAVSSFNFILKTTLNISFVQKEQKRVAGNVLEKGKNE